MSDGVDVEEPKLLQTEVYAEVMLAAMEPRKGVKLSEATATEFNAAFGEVVKAREDGLYEFDATRGTEDTKSGFDFDVSLISHAFGDVLVMLNLNSQTQMRGK